MHALRDPRRALAELSLYEFTKQAWPTLHGPESAFQGGWAVQAIAEHLQAVTEGQITKLLINVPPGCTKSMLTNVMWPAWEWGPRRRPWSQWISTSYSMDLPIRDMLNGRRLLTSEWYRARWPVDLSDDDRGKEKYSNTSGGFRFAASVGSSLTGWRGQRLIIDDPHSTETAESELKRETARRWMAETTPSRFTDPKRPVYVVIMQRLHTLDVSGLIIEQLLEEQGWVHLCLPMEFESKYRSWSPLKPRGFKGAQPARMRRVVDEGDPLPHHVPDPTGALLYPQDPRTVEGELLWPERYDAEAVRTLKVQLMVEGGEYAVAGQLQQRPVPREGGLFKVERLTFVDEPIDGFAVRGWDLAGTKKKRAAWTAGAKLILGYDGRLCIAGMERFRGDPDEVRTRLRLTSEMDGPDVTIDMPQDPGQAGVAQVRQLIKDLHGFDVRFSSESGEKDDRAIPFAAQVNAGNVCIVRGDWNAALLAELGMFPGSTYKDQTDALSRAYSQLLTNVDDVVGTFGSRLIQ